MTPKNFYNKFSDDIKKFMGDDGIAYLLEAEKNGELILALTSFICGNMCLQIRNHLRYKYPTLLEDNGLTYQEFEDLSFYASKRIVRETKKGNHLK